jgi:hypothetical protein
MKALMILIVAPVLLTGAGLCVSNSGQRIQTDALKRAHAA